MLFYRLKTVLLLGTLSGLLLFIGHLVGGTAGMLTAFIISLLINAATYFYSDKLVLSLYQAKPLDSTQYPAIYQIVSNLAKTMNIPMPKLWLVTSPMANAFATGRNPTHASVAVTTGILDLLDDHELRAVLAHELSHVKNRDILVSTIAATMATAISYIANFALQITFWQSATGGDRDRKQTSWIGALVVAIILPIAALLIQLAVSRSREYLADECGADASQDPLALASALSKLERGVKTNHFDSTDAAHAATASLFIVHPFLAEGFSRLFSTHPSTASRIARLRAMASQQPRH